MTISPEISRNAQAFACEHGFYADSLDGVYETENYLEEMHRGLKKEASSLSMIPTYLSGRGISALKASSDPVIVVDVGGTNVRAALVRTVADGRLQIDEYRERRIPGLNTPVTTAQFFSEIAAFLLPIADKSRRIGLCYSFESIPQPDQDAIIVAGGKQVQITDYYGKYCGRELKEGLRSLGKNGPYAVVVINDSVAALLGGFSAAKPGCFADYVGFIFGTGLNISYNEGASVVNTEAGGYMGYPLGDIDHAYISHTIDPDIDWAEKVISGRYFGGVCSAMLKMAAAEGLLSDRFTEQFDALPLVDTRLVSEFCSAADIYPFPLRTPIGRCCADTNDIQMARTLIDLQEDRCAKLISIALTAAMLKSGTCPDESHPICITAEGSTYRKLYGIREKIDRAMDLLAGDHYHLLWRFVTVEHATFSGTYYAGAGTD